MLQSLCSTAFRRVRCGRTRSRWQPPFWAGGRQFGEGDLDDIRQITVRFPALSQRELALTVCENLEWQAPNGHLRVQACLELLGEMAADGLITLPGSLSQQRTSRSPLGPTQTASVWSCWPETPGPT